MASASQCGRGETNEPNVKVLCLAGGIASGKTTLANALEDASAGGACRSFGDVVRRYAAEHGLGSDRSALQAAGEQLIARGWSPFVTATVGDVDESTVQVLVIEGLRHVGAFDEIRRQFADDDVYLVFVQTADDVARARFDERGERSDGMMHHVESEVSLLRPLADVVVDGAAPLDATVATVMEWIRANGES
jgi:hypothetical protein